MNSWVSALCWLWSLTWSCLWWLFLALINPHKSNMSVYFEWLLNRYSHTHSHTHSLPSNLCLSGKSKREKKWESERERGAYVCAKESERVLNQEPIFEWWSLNFLIRRCVSKNRNVSWNISFFFCFVHQHLTVSVTDCTRGTDLLKNLDHVGLENWSACSYVWIKTFRAQSNIRTFSIVKSTIQAVWLVR